MNVTLTRWSADDLAVLERVNTPEMTRFLGGGRESDQVLAERHAEYVDLWESGEVRMFRIDVDGEPSGYAGWWEEEHDGLPVYEVGCVVEPRWHGHGVASAALQEVVRLAATTGDRHLIVGYAHIDNAASNALCRRVGFSHVGTGIVPFEDGAAPMSVNVWMIDTAE